MTDNQITYQIRGAIYDVYKKLGPGLLESVYEEAMVYELEKKGLKVERQLEVPIHYDGHILKSRRKSGNLGNICPIDTQRNFLFQMMSLFLFEAS